MGTPDECLPPASPSTNGPELPWMLRVRVFLDMCVYSFRFRVQSCSPGDDDRKCTDGASIWTEANGRTTGWMGGYKQNRNNFHSICLYAVKSLRISEIGNARTRTDRSSRVVNDSLCSSEAVGIFSLTQQRTGSPTFLRLRSTHLARTAQTRTRDARDAVKTPARRGGDAVRKNAIIALYREEKARAREMPWQ